MVRDLIANDSHLQFAACMLDPTLAANYLARRSLLLRRLARLVGCRAQAEDLVQEAWLKACGTSVVRRPAAFLDQIALNLARDHLRGLAVRGGPSVAGLEAVPCPTPDAERRLLDKERLRRAEAAIAQLPPRRRAVFLAARVDGLPHAEIAACFGITTAAVEKHIARALTSLAAAMAQDG